MTLGRELACIALPVELEQVARLRDAIAGLPSACEQHVAIFQNHRFAIAQAEADGRERVPRCAPHAVIHAYLGAVAVHGLRASGDEERRAVCQHDGRVLGATLQKVVAERPSSEVRR